MAWRAVASQLAKREKSVAHIKGESGGDLSGADWLWLYKEGRAIALEYPTDPKVRPVEWSPGGVQLTQYFDRFSHNYAAIAAKLLELEEFFASIPLDLDPSDQNPFWNNGWYPPLDAIVLCVQLAMIRPKRYVEIGSGNSTKFARKLIQHLGLDTQITSIDPYPRAEIDLICDTVIREPLENLDIAFFADLDYQDMFFIDSSHRSFQNSDVTVFFLELLPALAKGLTYGIHDIFLPYDYPQFFIDRFYNEQYLLAAYLLGGPDDEIQFPCYYIARHSEESKPFRDFGLRLGLPLGVGEDVVGGGAFWARKGTASRSYRNPLQPNR